MFWHQLASSVLKWACHFSYDKELFSRFLKKFKEKNLTKINDASEMHKGKIHYFFNLNTFDLDILENLKKR